jgi:F0F1-type ATP synthase delta subunit
MIDDYTRLLEATAELEDKTVSDVAITKLILHLKSIGRMKMLPQIVRELKKVAARRHALRPHVEVAHQKEEAAALMAAAEAGIIARHASVNTSLIYGWRAREGGRLIDRSAKRALLHIYQQVAS